VIVRDDTATPLLCWRRSLTRYKGPKLYIEMKVFKTQVVGGKNSEFHRQDMWNAIETGIYPEWEVCSQTVLF
jgi:catalase